MQTVKPVDQGAQSVIDKDSNSIPSGNEVQMIAKIAEHMVAIMGE